MAPISPIPSTRVSDVLIRERLLSQVQFDQAELFRLETAVSTGRRFTLPSQNAPAALRSINLQRLLERKEQVRTNLVTNESFLSASDVALSSVSGVLADIRGAAVSVVDTVSGPDAKRAVAEQVERAIQQLVDTGNQKFRGRFLFAGSQTQVRPFERDGAAVRYDGNRRSLLSYSDLNTLFETNVTGDAIFGGISTAVQGTADLNPILTDATRLSDLRGGQGISPGSIALSNGTATQVIDISQAATIGDVARLLENNPPAGSDVTAFVTSTGLQVQLDAGNLTIKEVAGGTTVRELGILTEVGVGTVPVVGEDLNPTLRRTTRLEDILGVRASARVVSSSDHGTFGIEANLRGAAFNGFTITLAPGGTVGAESVTYDSLAKTITVDIEAGKSTANNVIDAINASAAAADFRAFQLAGSDGSGAAQLGTFLTAGGSGIEFDQGSGLRIAVDGQTTEISFASAETVEDVLNILNGAGVGLLATINDAANGIDVLTRLSGVDFSIGENGGATATELGIRSFTGDTRLADLHHGRGVSTIDGPDFLVRRKDGVELQIDLDSPTAATTITDVIDRINNHVDNTGAAVVARLATFGNGIELADANLAGGDTLAIEPIGLSRTAEDLGLVGTASVIGGEEVLTGTDVNPSESPGVFTALIRLHDALAADDIPDITRAIELLDAATTTMDFSRAELGARQQALDVLQTRLDDEEVELRDKLSKELDVDLVEAISELLARQAALEASLRTLSQSIQLTILNFL